MKKDHFLIGAFVTERLISDSGGMSRIYLAYRLQQPRIRVAIKVSRESSEVQDRSYTLRDLIRKEANILSQLRHPGIARIYPLRIGEDIQYSARAVTFEDKPWYYVMEYIPASAGDLHLNAQVLAKSFPLTWRIELFYQLLTIVNYMHKVGYAHCDLKPENVIFRHTPERDQVPSPVLVDFGSASPVSRMVGEVSASISYTAPEMWLAVSGISRERLNLQPDKVDVWALGALFFEIVTGTPLIETYDDGTPVKMGGDYQSMRSILPDLPASLDNLMSFMIQEDPAKRPPVSEIIEALEQRIDDFAPPLVGSINKRGTGLFG